MEDTIVTDILNLRLVSKKIEAYICNQTYVSKYGPDEIKETDILFDIYEIALDELKDLGIEFWDKQNSALTDWYQARSIYYFRKLFDEDVLLQLFKQNDSIISPIETIIFSEESDESDIHLILELLQNTFIDHPDIDMCVEFQDKVISNTRFVEHLKATIAMFKHLSIDIEYDNAKVIEYIGIIELGRDLVRQGVERIMSSLRDDGKNLYADANGGKITIDNDKLDKLIEDYDIDKIQPLEIKYYSTLDLPDDKIDPVVLPLKKKYMDIHHNRSPHHIEYWISHGTTNLTNANLVMLVAHLYKTYANGEEFIDDYAPLRKLAKPILTEEQMKNLDTYGLILMNSMRDFGMEDKYGNLPNNSIIS